MLEFVSFQYERCIFLKLELYKFTHFVIKGNEFCKYAQVLCGDWFFYIWRKIVEVVKRKGPWSREIYFHLMYHSIVIITHVAKNILQLAIITFNLFVIMHLCISFCLCLARSAIIFLIFMHQCSERILNLKKKELLKKKMNLRCKICE